MKILLLRIDAKGRNCCEYMRTR